MGDRQMYGEELVQRADGLVTRLATVRDRLEKANAAIIGPVDVPAKEPVPDSDETFVSRLRSALYFSEEIVRQLAVEVDRLAGEFVKPETADWDLTTVTNVLSEPPNVSIGATVIGNILGNLHAGKK